MNIRPLIRLAGSLALLFAATAISPAFGQDIDQLEQQERERPLRGERYQGLSRPGELDRLDRLDHESYHGAFDRYDRFRRDWSLTRPYNYRNRNYQRYRTGMYHRQLHLGTGTEGVYYYNYGPGGGIAY